MIGTSGVSLSRNDKAHIVPVMRVCNATCKFCSMVTYDPSVAREFIDVDQLNADVAALWKAGVRRFEITGGGEPTLHPNLQGVVSAVYGAAQGAFIKLYTNGARIANVPAVDEVNVSRVSIDPSVNQSVMRIAGSSPDLLDVSRSLRAKGIPRIRLSVPLIKGHVDSADAVHALLDRIDGLFDAVVLRPLYPATPADFVDWRVDNLEWIDGLLAEVSRQGLNVEFDDGAQCEVDNRILGPDNNVYSDWAMRRRREDFKAGIDSSGDGSLISGGERQTVA